ncbi:site-specific integrase [Corynebacterium hylobatis]|uniref:Site-specific integrase n=1 Tax=Corynebacterium hylobatis TaxID=1859290 RepID=A0A430I046_9CORY|nr:site-specific integrase [Corynebacterium hylobatis]RSZ64404.1 site-specific integrase [Corynebacterium hylobatis]
MAARNPGNVEIQDRWTTRAGEPSTRHGVGKRWRVRWVDLEGAQRSKSYTRKVDAKKFADEISAQLTRGDYVDPHERMTVGELWRLWEPVHATTVKPRTAYSRRSTWHVHVAPAWSSRVASRIRKAHVTEWVADMTRAGASPATVHQAAVVLRLVLGYGVDAGVLIVNPASGVRLPRAAASRRVYLAVSQVEQLSGAAGDVAGEWARVLVRLLAYTGLRWGEATGLRVEDVDLARRRLAVVQAIEVVGGKMIIGTPKTHEQRAVPLPGALVEDVASLLRGRESGALVFASGRGTPVSASNFRQRVWQPAVEDVDGLVPEDVRIHDLRHTAASLAISAGANVKAVQAMLGHASAVMTLDTYADLFPDDLDAVGVAMDMLIVESRRVELSRWWASMVATPGWVAGAMWLWLASRPRGGGGRRRHLRAV